MCIVYGEPFHPAWIDSRSSTVSSGRWPIGVVSIIQPLVGRDRRWASQPYARSTYRFGEAFDVQFSSLVISISKGSYQ